MEHRINTYIVADSIISSLGFSTAENLKAIGAYKSGIKPCTDDTVSQIPILAGLIDKARLNELVTQYDLEDYTRLEQLFILCIKNLPESFSGADEDAETGFILSTTKGNISSLSPVADTLDESVFLWKIAERVGNYFKAANRTHVISNACISGVSALIAGKRFIESGKYKRVIVAGGDTLSRFICSGFLSFKSISENRCRPYDNSRDGLTLGEACGAILLSSVKSPGSILLSGGAVSNDANHISGPSRTGDGLSLAIRKAMNEAGVEPDDISFVNLHGTATVYNDEMEAKATHLAGLNDKPVNSLKPYFGHTLGASGVIETIISTHQLVDNQLFGTLGYETSGVPLPLIVSGEHQNLNMNTCIKTASGFGGCNAAIVLEKLPVEKKQISNSLAEYEVEQTISISHGEVILNGKTIFHSQTNDFPSLIREVYKSSGEQNMKFYKMDDLCKLGYMAAYYLLTEKEYAPEEIGIVLSNSVSSLHTDIKHQQIIDEEGDKVASPAVFVYTLPNLVLGEICIRHKIKGENTFFITKEHSPLVVEEYARQVMDKSKLRFCLTGWCELLKNNYCAELKLLVKK